MMNKILIVEDNDKNMYLMSFLLKKNNYSVIKAGSGEEGMEIASREKPDLILMDIQLPGIDGLETTRRIREIESCRDIPIIAVTSFAMSGDRERLINGGCTGYIEKPINVNNFLSEVRHYLKPV
ncbi:MAG: response regulator [Actinobacteria bacterium]|nr:response regulator [Actinomycetota bacterium]